MVEPIDHGLLQVPVAEGAPVPSLLGHARQGKYLYDMSDDNEILKAGCFRKVDVKSFRVFIKYCGFFFFNNFQYSATSPSQGPGFYFLYRKWPANKGDCTLRSQNR